MLSLLSSFIEESERKSIDLDRDAKQNNSQQRMYGRMKQHFNHEGRQIFSLFDTNLSRNTASLQTPVRETVAPSWERKFECSCWYIQSKDLNTKEYKITSQRLESHANRTESRSCYFVFYQTKKQRLSKLILILMLHFFWCFTYTHPRNKNIFIYQYKL